MVSSRILRHVALLRTDGSEELSASFIRVTRIGELGTTLAVTVGCYLQLAFFLVHRFLSPWWRRRWVPPKRRFLQEPHGVISQQTSFFIAIKLIDCVKDVTWLSYALSQAYSWMSTSSLHWLGCSGGENVIFLISNFYWKNMNLKSSNPNCLIVKTSQRLSRLLRRYATSLNVWDLMMWMTFINLSNPSSHTGL
jgi:hypothetical protein